MKILFDGQAFNLQAYGGISRYFCEIASRMPALEHGSDSAEVIAPFHINQHLLAYQSIETHGLKVRAFPGTNFLRRSLATAATMAVTRRRSDVDVFHETYYSRADCAPSGSARFLTVFDMIHEKFLCAQPGAEATMAAKAHAVRRADHVVCISESTRRDLVLLAGVDERKTSVVHLGFGLTPSSRVEPPVMPIATPYLLYVGARSGYKNFSGLLCAYAQSSLLRAEFSLVCLGGGTFSRTELALIDSLGIRRERVQQVSGDDELLAAMYRHAAALIYPSLYEGFGIPPLEAMSFDCPVVCSNTSSMPEVVGDAAALFNPQDPGQMRETIEHLVTTPSLVRELVRLGRERLKLFSWDKCARETLEAYRHVLER